MPTPVVCAQQPLPRLLDVSVSISRPQTEIATDMTMIAFLAKDIDLPANSGRVKFYTSLDSAIGDFGADSEVYWAANAFFARSERPLQFCVGAVFAEPVAASLMSGAIDYASLSKVTDGAFDITVDGSLVSVTGLDFTGVKTTKEVVSVVSAKLTGATVAEKWDSLAITSSTTGATSTIDFAASPTSGTDVSALLGLTSEAGAQKWDGYVPEGLVSEAEFVAAAAGCAGHPIYGWVLDKAYRDTQDQKDFAAWIEARDPAITCLITNSAAAYSSDDTTNIGYFAKHSGYRRTAVMYHHNPQVYPDMSYLALALSVNYALQDSTLTLKFKNLPGIETSTLTVTQLNTLIERRINCYTRMGNNSSTLREGVQSADTWYTDSVVNLDNYKEELQVEVYNVFLRNPKVPYTSSGQDKLVSACQKINARYTRNGTFAEREMESSSSETGYISVPATDIVPVPVALATASERAARIAPPIGIIAYETGAFHKVNITVNVYN